jgi:hypothetical protein
MSKDQAAKQDSSPASGTGDTGFSSVFGDANNTAAPGSQFQTNFGMENTAMGDIFKAGNAGADEKKKRLVFLGAAGAALVVCVAALMFLLEESPTDEAVVDTGSEAAPAITAPVAPPAVAEEGLVANDTAAAGDEVTEEVEAQTSVAGSTSYTYNEKDGGPVVSAKDGAVVEVSRKSDFSVLYVAGSAKGGKFRIPNPPPGEIFWREQGSAVANKITVIAPQNLALNFSAPASLAANDSLSWKADGDVAYFRVEFAAEPTFTNVTNVFATAKTSVSLKDMGAGNYHVRLAGFNTAAGRWEYSKPSAVEVK